MKQSKMRPKPLIIDLFSYIVKPVYQKNPTKIKIKTKLWNTFRLWSFSITIIFFIGILLVILNAIFHYSSKGHSMDDLIADQDNLISFMILAVVYAPIVEELAFRLFLRYSPFRIGLFISIVLIIIYRISDHPKFINDYLLNLVSYFKDDPLLIILSIGAILILYLSIASLILSQIIKKFINQKKIKCFYQKYFKYLFYLSALSFGLIHTTNFKNLEGLYFLIPVLVLPQIILGLFLGYIRMKYGIIWSIILHAIHNGILGLYFIILGQLTEQSYSNIINNKQNKEVLTSFTNNDINVFKWLLVYVLVLIVFNIISISLSILEIIKKKSSKDSKKNLPEV